MNISTLQEYHDLAMRTSNPSEKRLDRFDNAVLGLSGESGELADIWKKQKYHGHPFDPTKILDELGDILWYVTQAADAFGYSLAEVARANIQKLEKRYPDGFSSERSINRELKEDDWMGKDKHDIYLSHRCTCDICVEVRAKEKSED